jgi:hypothetical protein
MDSTAPSCIKYAIMPCSESLPNLACLCANLPSPLSVLWTPSDPKLWLKIMFGPLTMHQYRLRGPHATPEFARQVRDSHYTHMCVTISMYI